MTVRVNGVERDVATPLAVSDVVRLLAAPAQGCAVAVNDEVVPRADWDARLVADGDRVEVLTAVQGG